MKKNLLLLGLLGLTAPAFAQSPFVEVNRSNVQSPGPYSVQHVHTVAPNVSWGVMREYVPGSVNSAFMRTNAATGAEFDFNQTSVTQTNEQVVNIHGLSASTALAAANVVGSGGGDHGRILRTTDGGQTWTRATTPNQFAAPDGYCNWVYMFDANEGVALGDPTNGSYEVLRTMDGGLTWSRVPAANLPAPLPGETGLGRSYFALGNTIWAGTTNPSPNATGYPVRVLKSTDRGLTWTASQTLPIQTSVQRLAFIDQQNGIATRASATNGVQLVRTTDGGDTWSPVTRVGTFFHHDIDAVPAQGSTPGFYVSVGSEQYMAVARYHYGSSTSLDGITWTTLDEEDYGGSRYYACDFIGGTPANPIGYLGGRNDATTGAGGWFKTGSLVSSTRGAALQQALRVYPNPSTGGIFNVELAQGIEAGTELLVTDVLGRPVLRRTLNATSANAQSLSLDLSREKAGVYVLEVRTPQGTALVRLVVE